MSVIANRGAEAALAIEQPDSSTISFHRSAQPLRCAYLLVLDETSAKMFPLPPSGEVIIGRARDADLVLTDPAASRRHVRLRCEGDVFTLVDLDSHNGTSVNGQRLAAPRVLASRDVITICDSTLIVHCDARAPLAPRALSDALVRIGERQAIIADPAMKSIYALLERLAPRDIPVLLRGETGSGKDVAAEALHQGGRRSAGRLVSLNCAALPEALAEGELFGYEKGAFSGAHAAKPGLLELAHQGTLFLDEVGELSLGLQAKLLRVLETRQVLRLGGLRERAVDLRVVSATNRRLEEEINAGRFRQDLLFRLSGAIITLPPLRDRALDLPLLAQHFLAGACAQDGQAALRLSAETMDRLRSYPWPGNIRQLKSVMAYVASTCPEAVVEPWHLPAALMPDPHSDRPSLASAGDKGDVGFTPLEDELRELERRRMADALREAGGVKTRAAALIAMPLRTFTGKLKRYGLGQKTR